MLTFIRELRFAVAQFTHGRAVVVALLLGPAVGTLLRTALSQRRRKMSLRSTTSPSRLRN